MPDRVGVLRLRHVAVETIIPKELEQRLAILNPGPGGLAFYIGTTPSSATASAWLVASPRAPGAIAAEPRRRPRG